MNRRSFIAGAATSILLPYTPISWSITESNPDNAEAWLSDLDMVKSSESPLILQRFWEPVYIVVKPIVWEPKEQSSKYQKVEVPEGFVTDLASIPRVFWSMLRPDAEYAYAAIVHDYLYWVQKYDRQLCDEIFRFSMEDLNVERPTVESIYNAVRSFGESAWKENKALKLAGERRILKNFPTSAHERWSVWKRNPNLFKDDV